MGCFFCRFARAALLLLLFLLLLPPAVLPQARGDSGPAPRQLPGWRLTFDEEFSGPRLDTRRWTPSVGTFPNRSAPIQYFLPSAITLSGGALHITSQQQLSHGHSYTSGEIRTLDKFSQKYGRLETRCRFPHAPGTWSAVYLLPADDSWPPEIDVAEYIGRDPSQIYLTNHWKDAAGEHQQVNPSWRDPAANWSAWHTYALEWQPHTVHWYIDGVLRGKAYGPVADVPLYVRLNTSVGGDFAREPRGSLWPQTMDVDYVRVYRRPGGPRPLRGPQPHFIPPPPPAFVAPAFVMPAYSPPVTPPVSAPFPAPAALDDLALYRLVFLCGVPLLVWWWMRDEAGTHGAVTAALAVGVGMSAAQYFWFRAQIVHWAAWGVAVPLLLAEMHGLVHTLGLQYTLWPRPTPVLFCRDRWTPPPIFVFIPTVNEGAAVLEPTVRGALSARARFLREFPKACVTVVLCNDGRVCGRPEWREVERLAARLEVACITRPVGGGAKAGNIEFARQAVGATGEALVVLFDADQVAEDEFLTRTVPPFADPSVGWVQTGQYYRNRENPVARWADDQQALFYRVLCPGKAALNAAFICGTNVVIRASALDEIGGLPQDTVTEDFAASLLLHSRWRSLFLPGILAAGLGPLDLRSYFAQQGRWATGTLGVLRRRWRLVFLPGGGLSLAQRIQYGLACTHYLSGLRDLVYLLVPFLFLLLGVSAIQGAGLPAFLSRFLPYFALSQIAFWHAARRRTTWRGLALGFGSFPVLLASLLLVIFGQRVRFAVTPKQRTGRGRGAPLLGQTLAGAGCLAGLAMAAASSEDRGVVLASAFWLLVMLAQLLGLFRLALGDRQAEASQKAAPSSDATRQA